MRLKEKNGMLEITTNVYQAKNGGVFIDWGNTIIKLSKDDADIIARNIPDFDDEQFNSFYKNQDQTNTAMKKKKCSYLKCDNSVDEYGVKTSLGWFCSKKCQDKVDKYLLPPQ